MTWATTRLRWRKKHAQSPLLHHAPCNLQQLSLAQHSNLRVPQTHGMCEERQWRCGEERKRGRALNGGDRGKLEMREAQSRQNSGRGEPPDTERERERDEGWPGKRTGHPAWRKMNGQPQPNGRASSCQMSVVFLFIYLLLIYFPARLRLLFELPISTSRTQVSIYIHTAKQFVVSL